MSEWTDEKIKKDIVTIAPDLYLFLTTNILDGRRIGRLGLIDLNKRPGLQLLKQILNEGIFRYLIKQKKLDDIVNIWKSGFEKGKKSKKTYI